MSERKEGNLKFLCMDINHFEGDDLTKLSDFDFELLAKKDNGYIFTSQEDFTSAFNAEIITTNTHQLRIIGI